MSLVTLLNDVTEITKRPDARARALLALNTLILEIVTNHDYSQDLVETTLLNPNSEGSAIASIPLPTSPAVRKVSYLTANGIPLNSVSPQNILDSSGNCTQTNIFYRSGNNLIVRSRCPFTEVRFGYYQRFVGLVEQAGADQHWLLDEYEHLLLNGTVGRVFAATGDDQSAQYYESVYRDLRRNIRSGLAEGD